MEDAVVFRPDFFRGAIMHSWEGMIWITFFLRCLDYSPVLALCLLIGTAWLLLYIVNDSRKRYPVYISGRMLSGADLKNRKRRDASLSQVDFASSRPCAFLRPGFIKLDDESSIILPISLFSGRTFHKILKEIEKARDE